MEITELVENEDGSATFEIDVTLQEKEALINAGFNYLLRDTIEFFKKWSPETPQDGNAGVTK